MKHSLLPVCIASLGIILTASAAPPATSEFGTNAPRRPAAGGKARAGFAESLGVKAE